MLYEVITSSYHSARGVITNSTSAYNPALTFIPQIGFRQCKKHFSFEIAGGVGYGYALQSTVNRITSYNVCYTKLLRCQIILKIRFVQ